MDLETFKKFFPIAAICLQLGAAFAYSHSGFYSGYATLLFLSAFSSIGILFCKH